MQIMIIIGLIISVIVIIIVIIRSKGSSDVSVQPNRALVALESIVCLYDNSTVGACAKCSKSQGFDTTQNKCVCVSTNPDGTCIPITDTWIQEMISPTITAM